MKYNFCFASHTEILMAFLSFFLLLTISCKKNLQPHPEHPDSGSPEVSGIRISSLPSQTIYCLGQQLDLSSFQLEVHYADGTENTISFVDKGDITGFDSSTPAKIREVTVSHGGHDVSFYIQVLPIFLDGDELKGLYYDLSGFPDLVIPEGVVSIADEAMMGSRDLESVVFPSTLSQIGRFALCNCTDLKSADLSKTRLKKTPSSLFEGCTSLQEVRLPSGLVEIGSCTFLGTKSLEEIVLPEGLESIGNTAFTGSGLVKVHIPNTVNHISRAFYACKNLRSVITYGAGPENISDGIMEGECFGNCPEIEVLQIPLGITAVGTSAAGPCKMTELVLHENVRILDFNAFTNVSSLMHLYIRNIRSVLVMQNSVPLSVQNIHVPRELLPSYMNDPDWGRFECFVTD